MISAHTFSNITDWLENSINLNKLPFGKITVSQNNNIILSEFREKNLDDYADNNYSFNINSVYPNPFNPATDIDFTLPSDSYIKLSVYNIMGQEIEIIFEGYQDSGYHSYTWNASDFASGIYYFHLIDGKSISTAKAMFVK